MSYKVDLAFINKDMQRRFETTIWEAMRRNEEIGGILFYKWGQPNNIHWKTCKKLFGDKSLGMISDWVVVPNTSNLRDRQYEVSDLDQFIAIAEHTADSRGCLFLHWHTHPTGSSKPSDADCRFWWEYFKEYGQAHGVVVGKNVLDAKIELRPCAVEAQQGTLVYSSGRYLDWNWINYKLRKDAKEKSSRLRK